MISIRSRYSEPGAKGSVGIGVPQTELWGVSPGPPKRKRSDAACARRRAKRKAAALNMTLKSYLRKYGVK